MRLISRTLFISDLDGTLLSPEPAITDYTAQVINSLTAKGLCFTFATARSVYSAVPITSAIQVSAPCLLMNGVSIYDTAAHRYIKSEFIRPSASARVLSAFEQNGVHCFMYRIEEESLICYYSALTTNVMRSFAEERKNNYKKPFVRLERLSDMADEHTVYFTTTGPYEELYPVKCAVEEIPGVELAFYLDVYNGAWYLEVFSGNASKASGIAYLRERYGFERVVSFGDNLNDLPMFSASDVSVAVGNARPEVIAAADFIAPPNTEDGVAKWLLDDHNLYNIYK
ncbi:MAG: HAD family hydrolase [Ruminococcus sp.]|nr:HAD family hydrolase [Ruminococcus sp.]